MTKLSLDALPDSEVELTDRDRIALAFGILREEGWFAPIEWCGTLCCANHGWVQVCEHFGMSEDAWIATEFADEPPSIWWHSQADSIAFYGSLTEAVMSPEMEARMDALYEASGGDDEAVAEWMIAHQDEMDADELIERTTKLVNLVDTLAINWSGGMEKMNQAIEVLRSVGLTVTEPVDPSFRIVVHPTRTPLQVKVRESDGRIALWFDTDARNDTRMPSAVLSRKDARDLMDYLRTALGDEPLT